MTDHLTERLHAGAEGIPAGLRPPSEVRRDAEHARRIRRVAVSTLIGAVVFVVAVSANGRSDLHTEPMPATPPTPSPSPGVHALSAHPLANGVGAHGWSRAGVTGPDAAEATPPPLMECVGDAKELGAAELHAATYAFSGSGFNNEFVLRFHDEASAVSAFADLQTRFASCHRNQRGPAFLAPAVASVDVAPRGPVDDMFEGEGSTTSQDEAMGLTAGHYQVYAAREGNVVVLVESYGGWGDRTSTALILLLDKALGPGW